MDWPTTILVVFLVCIAAFALALLLFGRIVKRIARALTRIITRMIALFTRPRR